MSEQSDLMKAAGVKLEDLRDDSIAPAAAWRFYREWSTTWAIHYLFTDLDLEFALEALPIYKTSNFYVGGMGGNQISGREIISKTFAYPGYINKTSILSFFYDKISWKEDSRSSGFFEKLGLGGEKPVPDSIEKKGDISEIAKRAFVAYAGAWYLYHGSYGTKRAGLHDPTEENKIKVLGAWIYNEFDKRGNGWLEGWSGNLAGAKNYSYDAFEAEVVRKINLWLYFDEQIVIPRGPFGDSYVREVDENNKMGPFLLYSGETLIKDKEMYVYDQERQTQAYPGKTDAYKATQKAGLFSKQAKYKSPLDNSGTTQNTIKIKKDFNPTELGKDTPEEIRQFRINIMLEAYSNVAFEIMLEIFKERTDPGYGINLDRLNKIFGTQRSYENSNGKIIKGKLLSVGTENFYSSTIDTQDRPPASLQDFIPTDTITTFFKSNTGLTGKLANILAPSFASSVVHEIRKNFWNSLRAKSEGVREAIISEEDAAQEALKAVEEAKEDPKFKENPDKKSEILTEEEIQERQRFLKQCILMTNLSTLAEENIKHIKKNCNSCVESGNYINIHKDTPYRSRFYMVEDGTSGDQSSTMNRLLMPPRNDISEFIDLKPAVHAYLIPKLRFFKVFSTHNGLEEYEYTFPNFSDPERISGLLSTSFDKGDGCGVKSFSWNYEGTTPATARNDVTANLVLYFQSFSDFINKTAGNDHPYVDLLLLSQGAHKGTFFEYDPSYYRIRVDVGWMIDSAKSDALVGQIGQQGVVSLQNSIEKTNKSLYLNMVDHEIEFKETGAVEIKVNYRAYVESALKGTSLDALASVELRKTLENSRKLYNDVLKKKHCTKKELTDIRLQLLELERLIKKQSYQSIMKRIIDLDLMRYKIVSDKSRKIDQFLKTGIFTSPVEFESPVSKFIGDQGSSSTKAKLSEVSTYNLTKDSFRDLDPFNNHKTINYFFLGDLLYVILDSLYEQDGVTYRENLENFKFILSSFQYEDLVRDGEIRTINLANIPISSELFNEWYTTKIIKPERQSYAIMYFIRDLCSYLVSDILLDGCFRRLDDNSLDFTTGNFIGVSRDGVDPFSRFLRKENPVIDVGALYGKGLPLNTNLGHIKQLYNYITILPVTPRLSSNLKLGKRFEDENKGIYHYQIGSNTGLVKRINFSKTDMQYIREARYFRNGYDGLMQLAAVYKVNLDMIGNSLYYPGMEVYIDPRSIGGMDFNPSVQNSIANKLGFGGYHVVIRVNSTIQPGSFTTTVETQFDYAGDGQPSSQVVGKNEEAIGNIEDPVSIEQKPDNPNADFCEKVYQRVQLEAIDISVGHKSVFPEIDVKDFDNG